MKRLTPVFVTLTLLSINSFAATSTVSCNFREPVSVQNVTVEEGETLAIEGQQVMPYTITSKDGLQAVSSVAINPETVGGGNLVRFEVQPNRHAMSFTFESKRPWESSGNICIVNVTVLQTFVPSSGPQD